MLRRIIILAFGLPTAAAGAALFVEGNAAFPAAEIEAAAYAGGALDVGAVERLYLRAGYLDVRVTRGPDEEGTPRLVVAEGPAYKIAAVAWTNDSPLRRGEVEAFVPYRAGDVASPPAVHDALAVLLKDFAERGYVKTEAAYEFKAVGPGRVDLFLRVRAGAQYKAGEIKLTGVEGAEEPLVRREIDTVPGKPLRERTMARDFLRVIDFYRARGYPDAAARPRYFRFYEPAREIDFTVAVVPGERVTINAVAITGNKRTRDAVIRRELTLTPGDPYDIAEVRDSARRVYNLKYFEDEPKMELAGEDRDELRVTVAERRTYRVTGALAYEPAQGEEGAVLIGEMDARLANLGGTGREGDGNYRRLAKDTLDAGLRYYEPWIGGVDLFAEPSGTYKERATYRKMITELALGTHPARDLTVAAGGGWERVWEEDASRKVKAFTWVEYDSRDFFANPRRGWQVRGRAELGVKQYYADDFREWVPRLELDAWRFAPTFRNQVVAVRGRGEAYFARRSAADEYYPLGGRGDLRGFKEEQFYTDRQLLATTEYRFLVGKENRLFLFLDAAYRHRKADALLEDGLEAGYGAGFRAGTPVGIYGVDYGLAFGAGPLDGMIHVTITEEF